MLTMKAVEFARNVGGTSNNMISFEEVKERLKRLDEMTLLETLGLTSEELVELLELYIEKDLDYYRTQVAEVSAETDRSA
jgi:hypothetical protein